MDTFKIVFMGILMLITYAYLFFMISKFPKTIAITLYAIVGVSMIALIIMIVWYPDSLRPIMDYLNIG